MDRRLAIITVLMLVSLFGGAAADCAPTFALMTAATGPPSTSPRPPSPSPREDGESTEGCAGWLQTLKR